MSKPKVNPFALVFTTLCVSIWLYLSWSLFWRTLGTSLSAAVGTVLLGASIALIWWVPLVYWQRDKLTRRADLTAMTAFFVLGFFSFLLVGSWARDLLSIFWNTDWIHSVQASGIVLGLALFLVGLGHLNVRIGPRVICVKVYLKDLPDEFEGFRIAQISDLHVGTLIRKNFVDRVVDITNKLQPDLIALTGDIFDGAVSELKEHTASLSTLSAREGIFYVTGNHEFYWDVHPWIAEAKHLGFKVLHNTNHTLQRGTGKISIAGIPDLWGSAYDSSLRANYNEAARGTEGTSVKILLAHQPKAAYRAVEHGFNLQLSGHTHGGQFFPWTFFVRFFQPFARGLHKHKSMWVYVNRGTGFWGPPLRLGAASEITLLELTKNESR